MLSLLNTVALVIGWCVLAPFLGAVALGCGLAVADMFVRKWDDIHV